MADKFNYDKFKEQLREKMKRGNNGSKSAAMPLLANLRNMGRSGRTISRLEPPEIK